MSSAIVEPGGRDERRAGEEVFRGAFTAITLGEEASGTRRDARMPTPKPVLDLANEPAETKIRLLGRMLFALGLLLLICLPRPVLASSIDLVPHLCAVSPSPGPAARCAPVSSVGGDGWTRFRLDDPARLAPLVVGLDAPAPASTGGPIAS